MELASNEIFIESVEPGGVEPLTCHWLMRERSFQAGLQSIPKSHKETDDIREQPINIPGRDKFWRESRPRRGRLLHQKL